MSPAASLKFEYCDLARCIMIRCNIACYVLMMSSADHNDILKYINRVGIAFSPSSA